ncbi:MAG: SpoVG family protein [Thermoanaerobaculum sp.]|nr:SpoVG family protein [Thermoanaerobaculum sp.]MDW7967771.1 SpoVG family protein [Thermoanaerobaculum sp.]
MEITEVRVNLNRQGRVKAFVQVVVDHALLIGDIRVMEGKEGTLYVAMPSRRLRNGSFRDVVHPLSSEVRRQLEEAILGEYERLARELGESNLHPRLRQTLQRLLGEEYWSGEPMDEE